MEIMNKRWSDEHFYKVRESEVLGQWHTGAGLKIEDGVEYQKTIPAHKNFTAKLDAAKEAGITLIQPRAGVALVD